jgi:hypothetical protein
MAPRRPKKGLAPDGGHRQGGDADPAKRLNGCRTGSADRAKIWSQRARRAARKRALERGEAIGLLEPFSRRLAAYTQAAIDRFLAGKEARQ